MKRSILTLSLSLALLLVAGPTTAQADGLAGAKAEQLPEFVYQGRLEDNGLPAEGSYDLTFTLWDAAAGGTLLGTIVEPDYPVVKGVFSVSLAFPGEFTGDQFLVRRGVDRYWVVAPLRVEGTKSMLPIVRGWTDDRLESPERPAGTVTFRAVLQPGEDGSDSRAFDPTTGIYDSLSIPKLANVLHGDLFSGAISAEDIRGLLS